MLMILAFSIINNFGKARILKFYHDSVTCFALPTHTPPPEPELRLASASPST